MAKKNSKEEMQRICEQHGVDKLYCNSKGEYFTQPGYAMLSEGNDKKKVSVYTTEPAKKEAGKEDKKVAPATKATKKESGDTAKDNDNPQNNGDEQNINQ